MCRKQGRLFERLEDANCSKADIDPLYSSFNKNGVFIPPPSSKEALDRQKQEEKVEDYSNKKANEKVNQRLSNRGNNLRLDKGMKVLNLLILEVRTASLVKADQTMFKRVQSSYGNRPKVDLVSQDPRSEYASTKPTEKSKVTLTIRSGAFVF